MGCLWAAHLQCGHKRDTNHRIAFIDSRKPGNPAQHENLRFTISSPFLAHIAEQRHLSFAMESPAGLDGSIDNLLVCTKSFSALPALKQLSTCISAGTRLVLFQNGLGSQHEILQAFPNNPVFAAVTTEGANRRSHDEIVHAGKGLTRLGPLNEAAKDTSHRTQLLSLLQPETLSTQLELQYEPDIWQALWHKLVINCAINPYTALLDCANGALRSSPRFLAEWPQLRHELSSLLELAGFPLPETEIEQTVFEVMKKTQENISSMLQDVRAGRTTEIMDINGFAAQYLESHGKPHILNTKLAMEVSAITDKRS